MSLNKMPSAELVECLLSPQVHVQIPAIVEEVEAKLTAAQVAKVFTDHVPGVHKFLFRQQPGQHCLKFMQMAYQGGFRAFIGTPLEDHLKWLFRLVVHYGYERKAGASQYLTEVAEAFMDCQAVQGRVVERIGLQIRGVTANFQGLVAALAGEYKSVALKMLAVERIMQGKAHDDDTPTHYENRLTADIGELVGLNADDVRRAALDQHASARFAPLRADDACSASTRCRELFDLDAFLQALVSELNSFSAESPANSMPRLFLDWVSQTMSEKHIVFDEDTCTCVEVDRTLALAVLETVFLGKLVELADKEYRGMKLSDIFQTSAPVPPETTQPETNAVYPVQETATAIFSNAADAEVVPAASALKLCEEGTKITRRRTQKKSKKSKAKRSRLEDRTHIIDHVFDNQPSNHSTVPTNNTSDDLQANPMFDFPLCVSSNMEEVLPTNECNYHWEECICPAPHLEEANSFGYEAPGVLSNIMDTMRVAMDEFKVLTGRAERRALA